MTLRQKQCLLGYLGLYTGAMDGIWGKGSKAAEEEFCRQYGDFTPENLLKAVENPDDFWEEIPNFTREEFRCRCAGRYCDGFPAEPSRALVRLAQGVRDAFGRPVILSSGVRCETHNANVGGVAGSRHKTGTAMDFRVDGVPAARVLEFVRAQPQTHYAYDIDGVYLHMDVTEP